MSLWKKAPGSDRALFIGSVGLLILSLLVVGIRDRQLQAAGEDEEFYRFVDVAAEIYSEIRTKYVDEVDSRLVLEGALHGMVQTLDEHSQYMNPDMLQSLERDTSGEFSGIGIHITKRQGLLTVIAPIPGSPAGEAGLQPWDRIIEIEGESTEDMTLQDAVKRLTGPTGTEVTFKVFRQGEVDPIEYTLTRASVAIESVFNQMLDDGTGYIRISRFSENTTRDVRRAILEMREEGAEGLILDLRLNTGGLLREAIDTSDLFVPKGEVIVSTRGRLRSQNREYRATSDPIYEDPLFVLVNEGSASASEILAGAIQDHGIGVIFGPAGKNTFGKGSVQTIGELVNTMSDDDNGNPMESALRLTTARYYTPSGRTIHHVGITPDIGVALTDKHELELMRHGLLGDVSTGEDYRIEDPETNEDGIEEGSTTVRGDEEEDAEPQSSDAPDIDTGQPFYAVEAPELLEEDDFVDIMLEEAKTQMSIYRKLQRLDNRGSMPAVASRRASEELTRSN